MESYWHEFETFEKADEFLQERKDDFHKFQLIQGKEIQITTYSWEKNMQNLYSIKDKAMGHYQVFMASNDYGAMRYCADLCRQENSFYKIHAEDLELFKLAEINTDSGETKPELKFIGKMEDYIKKD